MKTRRLGNSDLEITSIGLGTYALGGAGWKFAWGPQDDRQSIAAIRHAVASGINWIDTAAVYGFGHAEEIVAQAVAGLPQRPLIFTKCSLVWNERGEITNVLKGESIRREVEDSLKRLQVEAIDLYQIHWPKPDEELEEGWATMAELKKEGKVRWIGVSNFSVAQMERALKIAPITSLQPPYSMINRSIEAEILPFCEKNGIGVINYSPMQSGLLTGSMTKERVAAFPKDDFRRNAKAFQEPQLDRNLKLAAFLGEIGARHGVSAGVVAIAWTLAKPGITAAIVGGRSAEQVDGVMPAAGFRLTDGEVTEINSYLTEHP
jgi:aryl-alcohol dehydrogenase-like predicted oxidoreductase